MAHHALPPLQIDRQWRDVRKYEKIATFGECWRNFFIKTIAQATGKMAGVLRDYFDEAD
jgi:hypothetical protein